MKIYNYERTVYVENENCHGCMCHDMDMVFGDMSDGRCGNCGCPKTKEAWEKMLLEQTHKD